MSPVPLTLSLIVTFALALAAPAFAVAAPLPQGEGLAARYPGDAGIERDPAVVLAEDFELSDLAELRGRWSDIKNEEGQALQLDAVVPPGGAGRRSLRVTATRGRNTGGYVYRVLTPGYEQLFLRFYVRFALDYGFDHHFCSLGGELDPPPYPVGRAGIRPDNYWSTGVEPTTSSPQTYPPKEFAPPGIWHFYTYWPEMRSYENEDGTGEKCYGNDFEPAQPVPVPRGQWICVEIMVKMNSAPDRSDGEQAMWIDGKLVAHFAPGTPVGYWLRDIFRNDAKKGEPFGGIRWRHDMRVNINKVKLENYVSERAFERSEAYAASHPGFAIDADQSTAWFDHVVVSREYVGPMKAVAQED
ncbi:MAG: hypothetical protein ACE149_06240 [Armatimonadota bacterium]